MVDEPAPARPELLDGLVQLSFAVQAVLSEAASAHELSVPLLRLLGVLRDREPGMLELANVLGVDKSSMTGLVDRAERRGLVHRRPAEHDRRSIQVLISARGSRLVTEVGAVVYREITTLLERLSVRDRTALEGIVTRLVGAGLARDTPT